MKRFLCIVSVVFSTLVLEAKVKPAGIISDNMVLQQQTQVALWGTAEAGSKVVIMPGWTRDKISVKADDKGTWFAEVATPNASLTPYDIVFSDGEKTVVKNVLIGEVWLCSGQSNMGMQMSGYDNQPVEGSTADIVRAKLSVPIRMCTVPRSTPLTELDDCQMEWLEHTPQNVNTCSAVAYYFAKLINEVLEVPVGLVMPYFGGSPISAWMNKETIQKRFPNLDISYIDKGEMPEVPSKKPVLLFNGMIAPIVPFTIKGLLWYQGCEDAGKNRMYRKMQGVYVSMMRELFRNPDMPFYFAQLAPFNNRNPEGLEYAYLREAQMLSLNDIKNSGMVTTMDLGHPTCIHPPKKKEVGERFAYLALTRTYGMTGLYFNAPIYKNVEFKDGKSYVYFKVGGRGIGPRNEILKGFEVAGEDRVFYPATAETTKRDCIVVKCPQVKNPVAVRYGFRNWCEASVFSTAGIPASPFRTDNW
jgi:sialate O-acetylesterase